MKKVNEQKTYLFKSSKKWLGIIDYKSLSIIMIYLWLVLMLLEKLNLVFEKSFIIFVLLMVPFLSIFVIHIHSESAIDVILIMIKFYLDNGIYVDKRFIKKCNKIYKQNKYIVKKRK